MNAQEILNNYQHDNDIYHKSVVISAMVDFSKSQNEKIQKECRRIKMQRNGYELELIRLNRELMLLREELKINTNYDK